MELFTPHQYMKIMLANSFGLDNKTWSERLDWANDNYKLILNKPDSVAEQAKEKYSFLKAAHALKDVEAGNPTGYIGGLDATTSGIQITGALSGCRDTLIATNAIADSYDSRKDLYTYMVNHMSQFVSGLTRDTMKEPVMTRYYNSTKVPQLVFGEGEVLEQFYASLAAVVPGAEDVMEAINSAWQVSTYHEFTLPNGHTVYLPNVEPVSRRVRAPLLQGKSFTYITQEITEKDFGLSLPANIIHSIDAYLIYLVGKYTDKPFLPNHDCFYTSPVYMNEIRIAYNKALRDIHEMNLLNSILKQVSHDEIGYEQFRSDLGNEILEANYSIC